MKRIKITVLSLSLLTVMSGAAISPALGEIALHFKEADPLLIKLIITLPSLFIIAASFLFRMLIKRFSARVIALSGLILYVMGGCLAGLTDSIYILLLFRMILGIGVGLIMPLSTGLITYFFDKSEQSRLLGYSAAMNSIGGVAAVFLAGILVSFSWRLPFLVYLMGLVEIVLVILFLPKGGMESRENQHNKGSFLKILPYLGAMFFVMFIYFAYNSNFALIAARQKLVPASLIGVVMSVQGIFSIWAGFRLPAILQKLGKGVKYWGSFALLLAYVILGFADGIYMTVLGVLFLGFGLGILIPVLNAQIPRHVDKENITSATALMSAFLYMGQFLSPIVIDGISSLLHLESIKAPFYIAAVCSLLLLLSFIKIEVKEENSN